MPEDCSNLFKHIFSKKAKLYIRRTRYYNKAFEFAAVLSDNYPMIFCIMADELLASTPFSHEFP